MKKIVTAGFAFALVTMKIKIGIVLVFLCSFIYAQDNYFMELKHVLKSYPLVFTYDVFFSNLAHKWNQEQKRFQKAEVAFDSQKRKIKAMEGEIYKNESRISSLKNLERGEFEEKKDFSRRQQEATKTINELTSRNSYLRREIQNIEQQMSSQDLGERPHMSFSFDESYKGSITLDKTTYSLGYFDIDNKCFDCTITDPSPFSRKKRANGKYYLVKISCPVSSFKLYFDSAREAQKFKNNYLAGGSLVLPCSLAFSAKQTWERHMDAPARTEIYGSSTATKLGEAVLAIGVGMVVEALSPGSGHDWTKSRMPDSLENTRREEYIPAVYNDYDCFFLTCDITLGGVYLGIQFNQIYRGDEINTSTSFSSLHPLQKDDNKLGEKNKQGESSEFTLQYRKAAEQGHAAAQYQLGRCYYYGHGVRQDYAEAVKWFRKAAKQGIPDAQNKLGFCYDNGLGMKKNHVKAFEWYWAAAKQGLAKAQCNLAICYDIGEGVEKDTGEAVKWYRKAAEQGYADAQFGLGKCYYFGKGVSRNYTEAVKWYRKAAEQGHARAQCALGLCYKNGRGVSLDYTEAVKWYRKAAEQGNKWAQFWLGFCYYKGQGVSKDYAEAVKWYRKAAEQGHAAAQYNLGVCYYNGQGVTQDDAEAVKWYRKAAAQGLEPAKKSLERLSK